ncbi:MAG: formate dehydrogenase accessory sulfurtransferase FdhD [Caulobacteraceae bacterium]
MAASPTVSCPAEQWRLGEPALERISRVTPDEAAIGLSYDGKPHVVLMGTPADIEDLAWGFSLTEGVAGPGEVQSVSIVERPEGIAVNIVLAATARQARSEARVRTLEGRSSCGLCGVQRLRQAVRALAPVSEGLTLERAAIHRALTGLEGKQALGRATRATHAAAWCAADGAILAVREDVGRHNALDKVIGAAARAGFDPAAAFLIVTSRCSYEMVEKAGRAGVSVLVAISAPTALAIRKAEEAQLTLVALARADGHAVFTRPDRILDPVDA